jgi:hypothetical protein
MPSTDLAPARRVHPPRRGARRPAHLARAVAPTRWDPPHRPPAVGPPEDLGHDRPPRHFGATALPARHHWVLDTLMVLGALVVVALLYL